jgi:DNA-binding response OmpR family regulator
MKRDPAARLRVLVVEGDDQARDGLGQALEAAGHQVLLCPGPSAPDYTCIGTRGGTCALAAGADAVVLDTRLRGDDLFGGTTGWQLGLLYRDQGLPLVAVVDAGDAATLLRGEGVTILRRPASARAVLRALERAVRDRDRAV